MKGWLTLMKKIVSIVLVILTLAALMIPAYDPRVCRC